MPHSTPRDSTPSQIRSQESGATRNVTRLLLRWRAGDADALFELMPLVCNDLRRMARNHCRREGEDPTLQPTELVNEVFLKLADIHTVTWRNRGHFFATVAGIMRRILVDHARKRQAERRGGGIKPLPLDEGLMVIDDRLDVVLRLHEALVDLEKLSPRKVRVVELKFFVGLTIKEIAPLLEVGEITVRRDWNAAKVWLRRQIEKEDMKGGNEKEARETA